ncbi:hypothetical protein P153DRAFT_50142 [Dothidotthia symphoricarpi CBS 119687]|uniref:BTB domain-containing protein n=1 Tax=Dothidotthia symphoricarpi CBS 119687 TaxID=1392245 RepID=A0A6A6ABH3_9PLEO|nr:uncharacterized protein P153DRAFT_50142 [Dothidotthia symphoricarpi CBS 119687]KAF2128228.1 hypothetical protein P153DRAFT_50142 [Dothidotthia symphoricarpi CBS 119687]
MAPSKESIKALEKLSLEDPIPCCEPTTKPPLATFDRMMKVMVGAGCVQKEYHIHRGLLCFHSAYFKKLLDGPFEEGGSDSHTLSDVSINTFERFYYWLYTGVVTDGTGVSDANLGWADIINLYVFADFHMVQALKNRAVELFFLHMAQVWGVNAQCSSLMYAGTTQTSMLRKLHIDILLDTYAFGDSSWKDPGQEFPNEFLMDLIDACRTKELVPGSTSVLKTKGKTVWIKEMKRDFCAKYHDHRKVDTYSAAKSTRRRHSLVGQNHVHRLSSNRPHPTGMPLPSDYVLELPKARPHVPQLRRIQVEQDHMQQVRRNGSHDQAVSRVSQR